MRVVVRGQVVADEHMHVWRRMVSRNFTFIDDVDSLQVSAESKSSMRGAARWLVRGRDVSRAREIGR